MPTCQLRVLKSEGGLDGLLISLFQGLHLEFMRQKLRWSSEAALSLGETVREALRHHLQAFDTCGCSSLCDEAAVPSPWNSSPRQGLLSSDPRDKDGIVRYHLRLGRGGLPAFASSLARLLLNGAQDSSAAGAAAQESLAAVVEQKLSPHLFDGGLCRRLELCKGAVRIPVSL